MKNIKIGDEIQRYNNILDALIKLRDEVDS